MTTLRAYQTRVTDLRHNNGWVRLFRGQIALKKALHCGSAKCTHFVLCVCVKQAKNRP